MKAPMNVCAIDMLEFYISRAELFHNNGKVDSALKEAHKALSLSKSYPKEKEISIRIFVAKCLSNLDRIDESNIEYRSLIDENIYLPPIILGLLHNNLRSGNDEKVKNNVQLMNLFMCNENKLD